MLDSTINDITNRLVRGESLEFISMKTGLSVDEIQQYFKLGPYVIPQPVSR